jgi:hypothetical protein
MAIKENNGLCMRQLAFHGELMYDGVAFVIASMAMITSMETWT